MSWQQEHVKEVVAHLAWMAAMPGAKAHAWYRANDLARTDPALYEKVPYLLTVAMQKEAKRD